MDGGTKEMNLFINKDENVQKTKTRKTQREELPVTSIDPIARFWTNQVDRQY